MKKRIDKNKLKKTLIKYVTNQNLKSENELFSETLVELIKCVLFTMSVTSNHPIFEELEQTALIKLHKEIVINKRLDLTQSSTQNFNYLWTIIRRTIIAKLTKFNQRSDKIMFGREEFATIAEGRFNVNDNNWDEYDNQENLRAKTKFNRKININTIIKDGERMK